MKTNKICAIALIVAASTLSAIASEEGSGPMAIYPSVSSDGLKTVFAADFNGPDSQLKLWVSNTDGTGLRQLLVAASSKVEEDPALAPNSSTIAFTSYDGVNASIWKVDLDGSRLVQLTKASLNNRQPAWSPNGNLITFVSDRAGTNDIWLMNSDGSSQRRLTRLLGAENHPSFSSDGNSVVFSYTANGFANLMVVNTDGTGLRRVTDRAYSDWNPVWGNQGILFSSNRDGSEHWKPWVVQPDGGGLRLLSNRLAIDPVWMPNGNVLFSDQLAYAGVISAISSIDLASGEKKIVVPQNGYFAKPSIRFFVEPHNVNPKSNGKMRVAILSTATFDAPKMVNQATLRYGRMGTEDSLWKCYAQAIDVNRDGFADLICRFFTAKGGFQYSDKEARLSFSDAGGVQYVGADTIRIVSQEEPNDFIDSP